MSDPGAGGHGPMCGGRAPFWGLLPAQVLSVFWALTPGLSWPRAVTACHHPPAQHRLVGRGGPLSSPPSGFWSPTEAHVFQLDAEHCGPGAGGRGPAHPGRPPARGGNQSGPHPLWERRPDGKGAAATLGLYCGLRPRGETPGHSGGDRERGPQNPGGKSLSCWVGIRPRKACPGLLLARCPA